MTDTNADTNGGYVNPDGSPWVAAFNNQRPPFQPGHRLSVGNKGPLQHGVYSMRHVLPLADQIARDLRKIEDLDYLSTPRFADLLRKYSIARAQSELHLAFMEDKSMAELMDSSGGKTSPLEVSRQLGGRVDRLAARLGLVPVIDDDVAANIAASRKTLANRAMRKQLHADLIDAVRAQRYPDET